MHPLSCDRQKISELAADPFRTTICVTKLRELKINRPNSRLHVFARESYVYV